MWANHVAGGTVKTPAMARAVSPEKVAQGVLKAIAGAPEVIVASGPMRPLLAFGQMAPGMKRRLIKRMGVLDVFRVEADRLRQGTDRRDDDARAESEKAGTAGS